MLQGLQQWIQGLDSEQAEQTIRALTKVSILTITIIFAADVKIIRKA
jgi:hypothetical protein